jgi:hypothetical protein
MRFFTSVVVLGVGLAACGDDDASSGGGGGDTTSSSKSSSGATGGQGAQGPGTVYVIDEVYLGTRTFAGVQSATAWQELGTNIDGQVTEDDFTAHCLPAGGAPPTNIFPDGPSGLDNSWGKFLVPIVKTASSSVGGGDFEASVNAEIDAGTLSWAMTVQAVGDGPAAGSFFEVRDGASGSWLKAPEAFAGGQPIASFSEGAFQMGNWASGPGTGVLRIRLGSTTGMPFVLDLHHARIRLVTGSGTPRGTIAGVLDTEAFLDHVEASLGPFISCDGSAIQGILNQMRQGSDIMADGTQDPSATCNGISVGLGFTAHEEAVGDFAAPLEPPEDPCAGP